jgi:hypothetical protein
MPASGEDVSDGTIRVIIDDQEFPFPQWEGLILQCTQSALQVGEPGIMGADRYTELDRLNIY